MRILITNDDGIDAQGIAILVEWVKSKNLGEITVIAPKTQQSGKSQSIDIHAPFEIKEVDKFDGVRCISVDSSPADCVRVAKCALNEDFDLVLSGINDGLNIGEDIAYSGTCGAAFEASFHDMNCLALSVDVGCFEVAKRYLDSIWDFVAENRLFEFSKIWNVNIPSEPTGEIVVTRQCGRYFRDRYVSRGGNLIQAVGYSAYEPTGDRRKDTDAVLELKLISISPLTAFNSDEEGFRHVIELERNSSDNK